MGSRKGYIGPATKAFMPLLSKVIPDYQSPPPKKKTCFGGRATIETNNFLPVSLIRVVMVVKKLNRWREKTENQLVIDTEDGSKKHLHCQSTNTFNTDPNFVIFSIIFIVYLS